MANPLTSNARLMISEDGLNKKILIDTDGHICYCCGKNIKLGEIVFFCPNDKSVTCKICALSKSYHCPSRFEEQEHIDYRGVLTRLEMKK